MTSSSRSLAAENQAAAERTPLIATFPKLFFPFLAIVPGLIILSVLPGLGHGGGFENSYNMAIPFAMASLLPQWNPGPWPDRVTRGVYVGHGRKRHRLQYCLDLRHLPFIHQARCARSSLPVDGTYHHRRWDYPQRRDRLSGRRVQQYYGLCPGLVLRGQCPAAGDLPAWHVLARADRLSHLFCGDHRRLTLDQTQARCRTQRA